MISFLDKIAAKASNAISASLNIAIGVIPTTPLAGDVWATTSGLFAFINSRTVQLDLPLGSFTDTFVLTTGQTTAITTHTPVGIADLTPSMGPVLLDPSQITNLVGNVVTFNA